VAFLLSDGKDRKIFLFSK